MGRHGENSPKNFAAAKERLTIDFGELPESPFELTPAALKIYLYIGKILTDGRILQVQDCMVLARYADYYAEWIDLNKFLKKKKSYAEKKINKQGGVYEQKFPEATRLREVESCLIRIERDLGLTPGSRGAGNKGGRPPNDDKRNNLYKR